MNVKLTGFQFFYNKLIMEQVEQRAFIHSKHKQSTPQNKDVRFAIQPMFAIDVLYFLGFITFSET